ncbi:uncharacterized protein LTR77_006460 [Saxophila tyrrhenica]|uniref:DUF6594 domain-containing protein n=1 Tax=Saxophila tyrrhenica TaxID=1690608 RepID=A0AAV9P863_9PEZI|nr:hypothetical protein LTR77_006460 [Saxophila tyrrhenica]
MPDTRGSSLRGRTPTLVVSRPADERESPPGRKSERRHRRRADRSRERDRSPQWEDIDNYEPPRRRRKSRRVSPARSTTSTGSGRSQRRQHSAQHKSTGFFPSLSRIREATGSTTSSRPSTRTSETDYYPEYQPSRHARHMDRGNSRYGKSMKRTSKTKQRHDESLPKLNPSSLSILSGTTGTSDRSSNSSSTVTPESYLRKTSRQALTAVKPPKESEPRESVTSQLPNVFDFLETDAEDDDHDGKSVASASTSSQYEPSDAGSSIAPDTPSSRSTFPSASSPTSTRSQSVADLRKKYDPQFSASVFSGRSDSSSPAPSLRSLRKQPTVSDVEEEDEEDVGIPPAPSDISYQSQRSSSRSSRRSAGSYDSYYPGDEAIPHGLPYDHPSHYIHPLPGQHRSFSHSSTHSSPTQNPYTTALQHYHWPSPPPLPPQPLTHQPSPLHPPAAPEPPDLSHAPPTGYAHLALALSTPNTSGVTPVYRKFEYLNTRLLLHLQDELAELEEQLRHLDDIISSLDGHQHPASRRREKWEGNELHMRRTHLLGTVYVKMEQYRKVLAGMKEVESSTTKAGQEEVEGLRAWMERERPISEHEAGFLMHGGDLVKVSRGAGAATGSQGGVGVYAPLGVVAPVVLFAVVPTLAGRLLVLAVLGLGGWVVVGRTAVGGLMARRDWMICGLVYGILMVVLAMCMPGRCS